MVCGLVLGGFLAGRGDVVRSRILERFLRGGDLFGGIAVNRQECAAVLDGAFEAFGLVLGDTHADEGSDDSSDGAADTESGKRAHDGTGCDERADSGDCQGSDAGEQAECSANDAASGDAGRRAFRGFRILLVGKGTGALIVGEEHGDRGVREADREQVIDGVFRGGGSGIDAENGCVFAGHKDSWRAGKREGDRTDVAPRGRGRWRTLLLDGELIGDLVGAHYARCVAGDLLLLVIRLDRTLEGDGALCRQDFHVMSVG